MATSGSHGAAYRRQATHEACMIQCACILLGTATVACAPAHTAVGSATMIGARTFPRVRTNGRTRKLLGAHVALGTTIAGVTSRVIARAGWVAMKVPPQIATAPSTPAATVRFCGDSDEPHGVDYAACSTRCRRRSNFDLPNISRLITLSLFTFPSTWPLLQSSRTAASTARRSRQML